MPPTPNPSRMKPATPFSGPDSLRVRGERMRLVLVWTFLPLTLTLVGAILHNSISVHSFILILIGAMLFVALNRGRFLGGGVRIREGQFGETYAIVEDCARAAGVPVPHVFLREDPFVPIVAIGTGQPYALVISSQWIEHFSPGELRFLVGRELAHIAAGHTKITSLLSANGRENIVVAIAFGLWLRTIEYTADRVGLLCCGSLHDAFSAIAVSTFQHVGRKIDLHTFAEQRREIDAEPSLRLGEWLDATPYATNRIAALATFANDPLYARWNARFAERRRAPHAEASAAPLSSPGLGRRLAAFAIDIFIIGALVPSPEPTVVTKAAHLKAAADSGFSASTAADMTRDGVPPWLVSLLQHVANGDVLAQFNVLQGLTWIALLGYVIFLVAYAGQTLGMMICDLRVVGAERERIGLRRTVLRYICLFASIPLLVGVLAAFRRVQPFERWSRTRLVSGSTGGRA